MNKRLLLVGSALSIVALAYACTIRDVTGVPAGSIEVQPSSVTLLEGGTQSFTAQARDISGNPLPSGAVTWSSDAQTIFSINADGTGEALVAGQTTVWANLDGTRGSATVTVEQGPTMSFDLETVEFFGNFGGTAPDPITLAITNSGGGSLGGLSAAVQYPPGGAVGWLSLALAGTSTPTTLTLSVLISLLDEGTHTAELILSSPDARNSPFMFQVQVVVSLDRPIIRLTPGTLNLQAEAGGDPTPLEIVEVENIGGGTLTDLNASPLYLGVGGWLTANLTGKSAPTELQIQANPEGLSPGTYNAEVRVTGEDALNTPLSLPVTFTVAVGSASPRESTATVPNGTAGLATNITVQARDSEGNQLGWGGETVEITVSGANTVTAFQATDQGDGTYTGSYTPSATGTDNVAITMNGTAISGSPFTSSVSSGVVDPAASTATVPNGAAGSATTITVQARDPEGNPVGTGGESVAISVSGTNSVGSLAVTDVGDGTYAAAYTPTVAGTDNIAITMNGTVISGSPFTSIVGTGTASPSTTTASVPAGTAGIITNIVVQARDVGGNALGTGGESVAVAISGANTVATFPAADVGDGTYIASYTPTVAGIDTIAITLNSIAINTSPFTSTVSPGPVDPSLSTATVPNGTAGSPTAIFIQGRDSYGNAVSVGGETVEVSVSGANTVAIFTATDVGDGTYTTSYTPTSTGTDNIAITMNTTAISGSPFTSSVSSGIVSPAQSTATVPNGGVGAPTPILVQARDSQGNALNTGGETVVITVTGANTATPTVTDVGDGTYTASYTPTNMGDDNIVITMNTTPISLSPFTSTVGVGPANASTSTAIVPAAGTAGVATSLTVQARDSGGNLLSVGGEAVVINVTGANTATPTVTDVGNGTYTASYTPTSVGDDNIAITMNTTPISGSPFTSTIGVGVLNEANSTATVPNGTVSIATVITVQARDGSGNALGATGAGATVVVTVTGVNNPGNLLVTDVGDGTYTASYTPTTSGTDNIAITMNGTAISGSPFTSSVGVGNADPTQSTASVLDGTSGTINILTVQARDSGGNAITTGGEAVQVTVSGANSVSAFAATDNGNGTYSASYTPIRAGTDNIAISMNGTPINGSPFTSTVGVGVVSPANSTAAVPPTGTAGVATNITVQARDSNDNALSLGGETVVITVTGANTTTPTVTDVGNGTYTASYTPTSVGADNIVITMNTTPISLSPFTSTVGVGVVSPANSTATVPPTGTAGVATNITVQARDGSGNALGVGGETVVITVTGANTATPTVTDVGNGTYTASYTPTSVGADNIVITMNTTPISLSPFTSTVGVGVVSPANSTATVPPTGTAGVATNITVQARDGSGNALGVGGETVVINVTGANTATPTVTDVGNGTYTASYTPTSVGADNIVITMNTTPISLSPFTSTVGVGVVSPANSTAAVPPTGTAGVATNITVQARDSNDNALSLGGETVVITVTGANTTTPTVTDVGNGTYTASYTPTSVGADNIVITMNTTPISLSPFTSTVGVGVVSPANSTATVPPTGTAGVATNITVQARDSNDNALSLGGETVVITVTGANTTTPTVTDVGNGTYTASYTPTSVGADNIVITMNTTPISLSPFTSTVGVGVVSPANSTATVPPTGTAGVATNITVQARDGSGNALGVGGETVVITVTGANTATPTVTDVGNGTYTASYTPTSVGADNIVITMNTTPISLSPFTSTVGVGVVSPANSTATVPPTGTAGVATNITVQARDGSGNALGVGGETVVINVTGANTATPTVTDVGNGTYTASYTPTVGGGLLDTIVITMNGTPITGSPFTSTVSGLAATLVEIQPLVDYSPAPTSQTSTR